jgi:hypothetical protein
MWMLRQYKEISLDTCKKWQAVINVHGSDIDVQTCTWWLKVLELSASHQELIQIKQTYTVIPIVEQGGIVLAKLLLDKIDRASFEGNQALVSFISTFSILNYDGEDVSLATTCFVAAARVLLPRDRPSTLLEMISTAWPRHHAQNLWCWSTHKLVSCRCPWPPLGLDNSTTASFSSSMRLPPHVWTSTWCFARPESGLRSTRSTVRSK